MRATWVRFGAAAGLLMAALPGAGRNDGSAATTPQAQRLAAGGLVVSVAYAENIGNVSLASQWFPTPWNGSPGITFLGAPNPQTSECGSVPKPLCFDAGAIRLDNPTGSPISVTGVTVDVHSTQSGGKLYSDLWGSFTVPAGGSVILTENPPPPARQAGFDNFDSSDTPHGNCTPVKAPPTISITIGGVTTTLTDTQHVLDTGEAVKGVFGGVDSGWCPTHQNESVQWQQVGAATRGQAASLSLGPASTTLSPGTQATMTAMLAGGDGAPLPHAGVVFVVTAGPDAGTSSPSIATDSAGHASWSFSDAGNAQGADTVVAQAGTVGTFTSNQACVVWGSGACAPPPSCTAPWTCADVGSPSLAGSSTQSGGVWTIQGGGSDIQGTADQFQFVSRPLAGDGGVSAHVTSQTVTSPWAKAGVMLRATTAAGAADYALLVTPGNGIVVSYRTTSGGGTKVVKALPSGKVPVFVRVTRAGTSFTAATSADGVSWTAVPGSTVTIASLSGSILEGLVASSHNSGALCTVTMDSVLAS